MNIDLLCGHNTMLDCGCKKCAVKDLESQFVQAREEIEKWKAENESNVWLARHREAKLSKLERVRVAAEDLASNAFAECSTKTAPRIDYFVDAEKLDKLKIILAALRETEEKCQ